MPVSVPSAARSLLAASPAVGFSGSRRVTASSLSAFRRLVPLVPTSAQVFTGCARGLDQAARSAFPSAVVFQATSFGTGAWTLAARSQACVQAVAAAGGVWCSFPGGPCPVDLAPSRLPTACFSGSGSGSWASLALALGLGCPAVVFLPSGVLAPAGWGLRSARGGWFVAPSASQLGLF